MKRQSPFATTFVTARAMMLITILSLLPALGAGIFYYGSNVLLVLGASVVAALSTELLMELVLRRRLTVIDFSAVLTALIVTMILPARIPFYYAAGASSAAMLIKAVFGGMGRNRLNPAATAKLLLLLIYPGVFSDYAGNITGNMSALTLIGNSEVRIGIGDLLLGRFGSPIGTGCCIAVLLAAIILIVTGVMDGAAGISATILFSTLIVVFGGYGMNPVYLAVQLLSGSFLFVVFIMAGDPVTSPILGSSRVIYGLLIGLLTFLFRMTPLEEESAFIALLISNLFARFIDKCIKGKTGASHNKMIRHKTIHTRRKENNADSV